MDKPPTFPYLTSEDAWYISAELQQKHRRFKTDWRFRWRIRIGRIRYWWAERPWKSNWDYL